MLETYSQYAAAAVMPLTFRYGFKDPNSGNSLPREGEARCQGQFGGSSYCSFGHEFDCLVKGRRIKGGADAAGPGGAAAAALVSNATQCHAACEERSGCKWWSFQQTDNAMAVTGGSNAGGGCTFFTFSKPPPADFIDCETPAECAYGPADCGYGMPSGNPFPAPVEPAPPAPPAACGHPNSTACVVEQHGLQGGDCCGVIAVEEPSDLACMVACRGFKACRYWVRRGTQCHLKSSKGTVYAAAGVTFGPRCCDGSAERQDLVSMFPDYPDSLPRKYLLW
eukprot:SAG22_NODE_197_length_15520_cov_116.311264_2_plen_280_part_00